MIKKTRETVYNKYNGRCAYCGHEGRGREADWERGASRLFAGNVQTDTEGICRKAIKLPVQTEDKKWICTNSTSFSAS